MRSFGAQKAFLRSEMPRFSFRFERKIVCPKDHLPSILVCPVGRLFLLCKPWLDILSIDCHRCSKLLIFTCHAVGYLYSSNLKMQCIRSYLPFCCWTCSVVVRLTQFLSLSFTGPILYMLPDPNSGGLFKSTSWEHYSTLFWTISSFFTNCTWSWTASFADCFMQLHYSPPDAPSTEDHSACHKVRPSEEQNITYSDFTNS